jgi:NADP-dependent 3-hydroxy acid dehydrogenase YdfG/Tfp pilus assembly protein PilF
MEKIILAYAQENADLAAKFESKLSRAGVAFDHISDGSGRLPGQFVSAIQASTTPIILLVTDNLLRSTNAMSNALPMLQQLIRTNRLVAVVADGHRMNPETGQMERVETQFERVIHAIIYMNYWQSVYLELRQKKDHTPANASDALDVELRAVRDISNEIGEFLNTLRNAEFSTLRQFSANDFEQFFRKFGLLSQYDNYRKLASFDEPNLDLSENMPDFLPENSIASSLILEEKQAQPVEKTSNEPELPTRKEVSEAENLFEILSAPIASETTILEEPTPIFSESSSLPILEIDAISTEYFDELVENTINIDASEIIPNYIPSIESVPLPPEPPIIDLGIEQNKPNLAEKPYQNGHSKAPIEVNFDFEKKANAPTPTHAEIQAMVAEIVREEQQAAMNAGVIEDLDLEVNLIESSQTQTQTSTSKTPNSSIQALLPESPTEDLDKESRPVLPLQLAHFQPVSSKSSTEDDFEITLNDARFWLKKGRLDEARQQAEELVIKFPNSADGHFLLAEIAENRSDFEQARRHFEKTLMLDEAYPFAHLRLARILDLRFRHEKKEAARHFRAAAKIDPTDTESTYRAAIIYLENLEKPEKARKYFQKTVERQPDHALAWYDLAHVERQLGNFDEAADAWQQAVVLNPAWRTELAANLFLKTPEARSKVVIESTQIVDNEVVTPISTPAILEEISEEIVESTIEIPFSNHQLTVLITGATSGIGRATAEIFAKNGHRVLLAGRRLERLNNLEKSFSENYKNENLTACFDIRDRDSVKIFAENLPENWQNIDLLINNAGLAKGLDAIHEANLEHWDEMIDTNLKGLLYMTRQISPQMVARGRGQIINIGSIAGKEVYPKGNVYNATKFAVDALTRSMRLDLVPHGIRVSSVSPGAVEETEFSLVRFDGDAEKAKIYADYQPLTSADVAETIYFIATRPAHVAIHDIVLTGAQQASATQITRSGRA